MATSTPQEITILVVDDEEDVVEIISHFLREEGYNVLTAYDADEALSKASPDIDATLLDVMLPGMSGFEIAKRIRGRVCKPNTQILSSLRRDRDLYIIIVVSAY